MDATTFWSKSEEEGARMDRKPTKQEEKEFILGNKAADLWLTICDACANEKVIPKKYRYTTGTSLMNTVESICGDIEEANLIDLREAPRERLALQRSALRECKKLERKIIRLRESDQYPGVNSHKSAVLSKAAMTVRYMCAAWYDKDKSRAAAMETDAGRYGQERR